MIDRFQRRVDTMWTGIGGHVAQTSEHLNTYSMQTKTGRCVVFIRTTVTYNAKKLLAIRTAGSHATVQHVPASVA